VAKKKDNESLDIVKVEHPGDEHDAAWLEDQNEKLVEYRLTGVNRGYVDPTRDQEPDIAPEFGVSPHPELFNPAPPASSFSGRALDESKVPMVKDAKEKAEDAKEATEAFNEALQEREKLFEATKDTVVSLPAQPVYVVDKPEASDVKASAGPVGDESVVLAQTANPAAASEAQLETSRGVEDGVDGVNAKSDDKSK
jgi:hypothetical protein